MDHRHVGQGVSGDPSLARRRRRHEEQDLRRLRRRKVARQSPCGLRNDRRAYPDLQRPHGRFRRDQHPEPRLLLRARTTRTAPRCCYRCAALLPSSLACVALLSGPALDESSIFSPEGGDETEMPFGLVPVVSEASPFRKRKGRGRNAWDRGSVAVVWLWSIDGISPEPYLFTQFVPYL